MGGLIGFDKHLNLVLKDCEEFRALPKQGGAPPAWLGWLLREKAGPLPVRR